MEEQKIPSRSERHKKKKKEKPKKSEFFFSTIEEETIEPVQEQKKPTDVSGKDWYFTAPPAEKPEPSSVVTAEPEEPADPETEPIAEETEEPVIPVSRPYRERIKEEPQARVYKKRRSLHPAAGFLLLLLMLIGGVVCGYGAMNAVLPPVDEYYANNADQEMRDNINVLVLGCDEREGENVARADVIIVATLRPGAKEASMFSLPRDTRVAIEGHGHDKINHAMSYGGIPLVQSSVENLLGVEIDHYVKVNFDGFINVIDALGGVNVEVPTRMYKPLEAIDLLPGYQTLDGADALAFVRWRGDGTGDYGRIERQQQFIAALTEKVKGMSMSQALNVVSAVMDSIETDMSVRQMTSYGTTVLGMGTENIKTYSFVGSELWLNGVNYVEPDMNAINDIVNKMQHGEPEPEVLPEENPDAAQMQ
ncbi:MAG: LCP family protein [Peptococcaceae bacterium]|nr:LCP family protein [Peptococcaceae bacterium]